MNNRNLCLFFFVLLILPKLSFSDDFPTRRTVKTLTISDTDNPFVLSSDIAIDKNRNVLYVPSNRTHKIQSYDTTGKFLFDFGVDETDGKLDKIKGLWVDGAGKIFVVSSGNNQVFVFDSQGSFLFKFKTETYAMDVVSNSLGDIYVSINDLSNAKIMVYDSEGKYKYSLKKIPISDDKKIEFGAPVWLSITSDDHLLVADALSQRIYVFDIKGKLITYFGGLGDTVGKFYSVSGVAVDNKNRIYVIQTPKQRFDDKHY